MCEHMRAVQSFSGLTSESEAYSNMGDIMINLFGVENTHEQKIWKLVNMVTVKGTMRMS